MCDGGDNVKRYLQPNLQGLRFFNRYVVLYAIMLGVVAAAVASIRIADRTGETVILVPVLLICYAAGFLLYILFLFFLYDFAVSSIEFAGVQPRFHGRLWQFVGHNVKWLLLSVITLGIYTFWYIRNVISYLLSHTEYDGDRFSFEARGGRLFLIALLTYMLPVFAVTTVLTFVGMGDMGEAVASIVTYVIMIFILLPYTYLGIRWAINIRFRDFHVTLEAAFLRSILVLFVQYFLMIVTLYVYYPVASLKIYAYFLGRTRARGENASAGFGFDGDFTRGFLLIWGQTLLTLITLGVYYPWAVARVGNWLLSHVYIEADGGEET